MTRPQGTSRRLAMRRRLAMSLLDQGESLQSIASLLNVHPASVLRWRRSFQSQGHAGLDPIPQPGRPNKLTSNKRARLHELLTQGPRANGFDTAKWSTLVIHDLITSQFGVNYHRSHISRLLRTMGWRYRRGSHTAETSGWFFTTD